MSPKPLPEDLHSNTIERFERLMTFMAPQVVEIPEEEQRELNQERDEDYGDI
jgi:hypothetical protein